MHAMRGGTKGLWCSVVALLLLLHARDTHAHGGMIENGFEEDSFSADWEIEPMGEPAWAEFYITVALKESNAWAAIGFTDTTTPGDANFDVILAYNGIVTDRWGSFINKTTFSFILDTDLGGTNDVRETKCSFDEANGLQASFTRNLKTNDKAHDFDIENTKPLVIFYAYGTYDGDELTVENSDFIEKSFYPEDETMDPYKTHGILMVVVVMIFMTSGMMLSRYMKTVFYWWFYVHAAVFVFAMIFIIISTVIIFKAHGNTFLPSWHSIFGLFFIIAMGSQSLLGLLSHLQFDKKRLAPPAFPDKTHWWLGRTCFFIGVIAILLGFDQLNARRLAWNSFWLFLILIFFLLLTMEKYVGQTHEVVTKGISEDDDAFDTRDDEDLMYVPKKGNSLSIGRPAKQLSMQILLKILVPAGIGIGFLFILVSVGIGTTTE